MRPFTREEEYTMWKFLLKEAPNPFTGLFERERIRPRGLSIWEKFKEDVGSIRTVTSLRKRFSMPSFPTPFDLDFTFEEKVQLMYAYQIPVDPKLIPLLTENGDLELSHEGKIVRYTEKKEGGLELHLIAKQGWIPPKRKAPPEAKVPIEAKISRLDELIAMNDEPLQVEENFYENDFAYDDSVVQPTDSYAWMLSQPIKVEPTDATRSPLPTLAAAATPPAPRAPSAASTEISVNELVEKKVLDSNLMQNFLASLTDTIVNSHSSMLTAMKELVPVKTEPSSFSTKPKKKKKKKSVVQSVQNGYKAPPPSSEEVPKGHFLEGYTALLSGYSSSELDSVKQRLEEAVQNTTVGEDICGKVKVERIKLISESVLAFFGY